MNWLHYLLEANLYLGVFYLGYYLFLSRETYYTLNRVYLLFSCVVSFALPVLQLGILKPVEQSVTAVNFAFTTYPSTFVPVVPVEPHPVFTWQNFLVYGYILGAMILLIVLTIKLISLYRLTRKQNLEADGKFKLVYLDQSATAFSFFNYLFIGTKVQGSETIIRHELVHIRQKHSADIIFIELLKIVNWFNPFIYFIQYSLKTIHEYIADEQTAVAEKDALAYSSFLVNNAYGLGGSSITHSFFNYNLLKKRIIMLHQKRSGSLARLKYLVAVPICAGLLCASTLAFSKSYGWVDIAPHRIDKNNKSPQVKEPKRMLLVTENGHSIMTDKFSYKKQDGTIRIFTPNNISNKNIEDLKNKGVVIYVLLDVKVDTTKINTAAPGSKPVQKLVYGVDSPMKTTSKGFNYMELQYLRDGKTDMSVTIFEKKQRKVFDKNKATSEDLEILKTRYGYVFPAHFKTPQPPQPPAAPSTDRRPPAPPAPLAKATVFSAPKSPIAFTGKNVNDARHLLVTENGKSTIIDNFVSTNADGSITVYTVNNFSNKKREEFKKRGIIVDIIDDPSKYHIAAPPPFASSLANEKQLVSISKPVAAKYGYAYIETEFLLGNNIDFKVEFWGKHGSKQAYFKSTATADDIKLLADRYGYSFPSNGKYHLMPIAAQPILISVNNAHHLAPAPPVLTAKTKVAAPKAKINTIAMTQKYNVLSVDSDALGRMDMMVVVHKKGC